MLPSAFEQLKQNLELNPGFYERIKQRHATTREVVENNIPGATTKLIGSLGRKTRIHPKEEGEFDIDILVVLGTFYSWLPPGREGVTPSKAIRSVHDAINEQRRYAKMDTETDEPTVTIKYKDDINVEFVPAYVDHIGESPDGEVHGEKGRGYWIVKDNRWVLADYDYEAEMISGLNALCDGKLIPTLKMLKCIKREHCPQFSSFHLEMSAAQKIAAHYTELKSGGSTPSYPDMLLAYLCEDPNHLLRPVKLLSSKTPPVVLGLSERDIVEKLSEIREHCHVIRGSSDDKKQLNLWKALFGAPFPL